MNSPLRIVYFGTAAFAVPPLQALLAEPRRFNVLAVVSRPDKPAGRNGELAASPASTLARDGGAALLQPETLKDAAVFEKLKGLDADLFIVAAYGKIIPQRMLDLPRIGSLNLHGSLLPKYRGASPIQTAILEGEKVTGVSLLVMDAEVDRGPIVAAAKVTIMGEDTRATLEAALGEAAAGLLTDNIEPFAAGKLEPVPQEHDKATFTKILDRKDGMARWAEESAARICRKIRAYDPWPGAYFVWKKDGVEMRVKIIKAAQVATDMLPGTCFTLADGTPAVAAAPGAVALLEVQPEGKKPMQGKAFANGHKSFAGSRL